MQLDPLHQEAQLQGAPQERQQAHRGVDALDRGQGASPGMGQGHATHVNRAPQVEGQLVDAGFGPQFIGQGALHQAAHRRGGQGRQQEEQRDPHQAQHRQHPGPASAPASYLFRLFRLFRFRHADTLFAPTTAGF